MASVSAVVRNQGGAIHGGTTGVLLERGGTVTNLAGSVIGASSGHGISVVNDGGSVANAGAISGGLIGVLLDSGGNVANGSTDGGATVATGAEISGGTYGLWIGGSGGNVVNYAGSTIRGNGNAGVLIAGASGTVDNRGIIDGLEDGIRLESGGTVINRGIVRGGTTAGIALANGGTLEHLGGQIVAQRGSGVQAAGGAISHATIEGAPNAVQFMTGNNTLALHAGSVTVGALRMGSGADRVTVFADADISRVPLYEGGTGSSTLAFDGYRGSVPGSIDPWTVVAVAGGADVTFTSVTRYEAGLFRIDSGTTLRFSGDGGTLIGDASNQGTLSFANGSGAGVYRVTGTLANGGLVDLASASGGAGQLLFASLYAGSGGTLRLKTVLAGDGAASDLLVIDGGTATGTTGLRIVNAGGAGALTTANGILVVDTVNASTTTPAAFALDGRAVAGAYEYRLFRGGTDGSNSQAWYLRSAKPPQPAPPGPGPTPSPPESPAPPQPQYRPEVAAYLANQRLVGQMFVHSLHDRLGEPQYAEGTDAHSGPDSAPGSVRSGWLRALGNWEGSRSRDGDFKVGTAAFLLQGGAELARWRMATGSDRLHVGAVGSYGNAGSDARADGNPARAKGSVQGWSIGAYGTWYQNDEHKLGAYVDTWLQYGWLDNKVEGDGLPTVSYGANGWAISGETGYAFPLRGGWVAEPQAQLVYVKYGADDVREPNGTRITGADSSGVITRVGARLHRTFLRVDGRKIQPYATLNWWHAGIGKRWRGWANVAGAWGAQSFYQYALRAGVKYAW